MKKVELLASKVLNLLSKKLIVQQNIFLGQCLR